MKILLLIAATLSIALTLNGINQPIAPQTVQESTLPYRGISDSSYLASTDQLSQIVEDGRPTMNIKIGDHYIQDIPISSSSSNLTTSVFTNAITAFANADTGYRGRPVSDALLQALRNEDHLEIRFTNPVDLPLIRGQAPRTVEQVLIPLTDPDTVEETMGWGNFYYSSPDANTRSGWSVLAWSQLDREFFISLHQSVQQLGLSEAR